MSTNPQTATAYREAMLANIYRMCALICAGVSADDALRLSRKVARAVRALIKAQTTAYQAQLKRAMLATPHWRARVLRDLGGKRALERWDERFAKAVQRQAYETSPRKRPLTCAQIAAYAWMKHKRQIGWTSLNLNGHPRIVFDRVRTDFEGQFRLAPLPRRPRKTQRRARVMADHHQSRLTPHQPARAQVKPALPPVPLLPSELRPRKVRPVRDYDWHNSETENRADNQGMPSQTGFHPATRKVPP